MLSLASSTCFTSAIIYQMLYACPWKQPERSPAAQDMDSNGMVDYFLTGALSLLVIVVLSVVNERRRRRRLPPGPVALPVVGHLHLVETNVHDGLGKLSDKYGPLITFRFGMKPTVVLSSSEVAKQVLKHHDHIFANRSIPVVAHCIAYDASDILWSPYGPRWHLLRKICVKELFSSKSLQALHHLRQEEVRRTVRSIYVDSGKGVDVGAKAFATSVNLATTTMWSRNTDTSAQGKEFKELMGELVYLPGTPNVSDLFPFLEKFDLQRLYRRMYKVFVRFDSLFDSIIEERVSGKSKGSDFLQLMLDLVRRGEAHEEEDAESENVQLTMKDVKVVLMDIVTGLTDTTSNTTQCNGPWQSSSKSQT